MVQFWEFSAEFSLQSSQKMMMLVGGAGMLSSSCVRVVSIEREKRKKETEGKRESVREKEEREKNRCDVIRIE